MLKKLLGSLMVLALVINSGSISKAENSIKVYPASLIVNEKDVGKDVAITIENNTSASMDFSITEIQVQKTDNNISPLENKIEGIKRQFEFDQTTITVAPNSKRDFTMRIKLTISSNKNIFPAVSIKPATPGTVQSEFIVPFFVQTFNGTYVLDNDMSAGDYSFITSPEITVKGTVKNSGQKFFDPRGTVTISKNDTRIAELEITTQINGMLLPGESRNYELKYKFPDQIKDLGQYTIESKVNSDLSDKSVIVKTSMVFVPIAAFVLAGGIIMGLAIAFFLGKSIINKRRA
jgi:hypothetical protein